MEYINKSNFDKITRVLLRKKYEKILIVSGAKSYYSTKSDKIIKNLIKKKQFELFLKKSKIPEYYELKKLIKHIIKYKPDIILSCGGGAVLDLSKVANSLAFEKNIKKKIKSNNYKLKNYCDLFAIPTTAGTGAEVTTNAVIYVDNIKYSIEGELIKPKYMALMPELVILNQRRDIISSSAFDSFAQSIESMFSKRSTKQSLNYSKKSILLFMKNYKKFIKSKSLESGYRMSLSSYYSGKAISISKTIAPHAVSYPFTSYFNINHGHAVSLTFDSIIEHNYKNIKHSTAPYNLKRRYKILFRLLKIKNIEGFISKILSIKKDLALENKLSKINNKIPKRLNLILKNINNQRLKNNPTKISKKDIYKILENII